MLSERRDGRNVAERIARVIVEAALSGDIAAARLLAGASFTDNATDSEWWCVSTSTDNLIHLIEVT